MIKIDILDNVSLTITEKEHIDYIEIYDFIEPKVPIEYDEHTHTFDIHVEDISDVIELLQLARELISQEYIKRGIL